MTDAAGRSTRVVRNATATLTALALDSERWDTGNIHDTVTNPTRLTAQVPGKYYIFATVTWTDNPTGAREITIKLNGTSQVLAGMNDDAFTSGSQRQSVGTHYELAAGDYVELVVVQRSGGPLNVLGASNHPAEFGMVKLP